MFLRQNIFGDSFKRFQDAFIIIYSFRDFLRRLHNLLLVLNFFRDAPIIIHWSRIFSRRPHNYLVVSIFFRDAFIIILLISSFFRDALIIVYSFRLFSGPFTVRDDFSKITSSLTCTHLKWVKMSKIFRGQMSQKSSENSSFRGSVKSRMR